MSRTPLTGAIATPHVDATRSAEQAFARGGNAIDAALAAAATLGVVYPHNVSIGGDLIALVRDPSGRTRCVNASGPAASAVDRDAMREAHGEVLPYRGIDTVTVPGAVRGWDVLRRMGGRLEWGEIFTDAVAAARDGVPVSRSLAAAFREEEAAIGFDAGFRDTFLARGLPVQGDDLVQPVLARTLEAIRDGGAAALYDGELTAGFVDGLARLGSRIGAADLLLFHPEVVEPLTTSFGSYRVLTSPPNTHGFVLLRVLGELERQGIADPLGTDFGRMMERFFAANLVRDELLADPRVTSGDVTELLTGDAIAHGDEPVLPGFRRPRGDTVGIAVSDSSGWSVSLIQSVYHAFGAAVVEPSTGILLHNRGTGFSLDPASPNALAPGKRPLHTLMPVMVDDAQGLRFVSATMGGQGQPQIHAQTLLRAMAGATAQEAVSAPRAIVGPQRDGDSPSDIYVEGNLAAPARASLDETRLHIIETPDADELVGHANLVIVGSDGGLDAGSDPRSDGAASVRGYGG
ncbi:gamma-glutamyltransferase family protein [uncultured Microbacterium sp.]|uniref:gamma-glutamyltransferase family protein n=1 Tax=uncultured Microbacterium sp. TaxID=191216 RepID=UPI003749596E